MKPHNPNFNNQYLWYDEQSEGALDVSFCETGELDSRESNFRLIW